MECNLPKNVWINNSRVGRYLAEILGNQSERLNFAISKLISVVVPLDLLAFEPQTIPIAATAGNVTVSISPRVGHRMRVLYGRITLVADATVANRAISLCVVDSSNNVLCKWPVSSDVTASQTKSYSFSEANGYYATGQATDNGHICIGDLDVYGTDKLYISVGAGVAAVS